MTNLEFLTFGQRKDGSYKPDILTCLANLSNDEVFTPPTLANEILDLLPAEVWTNPNIKFLDPVCKSGVFLREIARRLMDGLKDKIKNDKTRRNHIFTKQVFGIAITELTAQMTRRSVYCSKTANGQYSVCDAFKSESGNVQFNPISHTFVRGNCKFCGASEKEYGTDKRTNLESHAYEFIHLTEQQIKEMKEMKFDVIIGNPPYQLSTAQESAQAIPIYNHFVEQAKKLQPRYLCMITPSRWLVGGMRLDEFREKMLADNHIRVLHDFEDTSDCFSGVEIKGGVSYFLWDKDYKGDCEVFEHNKDIVIKSKRPLLEDGLDVYIRKSEILSIFRKVKELKEKSFGEICSPMKPFGLPTSFNAFITQNADTVKVYANQRQGYVDIINIAKNREWIDKYKVIVPKAIGIGNVRQDWIKPIIAEPNSVCTETYIVIGPFETKAQARNVVSYIQTKFFHTFLSIRKITQDTLQKTYSAIPLQDFSKSWTDAELYKKYDLSQEEIETIEKLVRPMDNNGECKR
jgi:site-specific DNA-methyltransferase (adenine-specific)